jgi:hypothetical protein
VWSFRRLSIWSEPRKLRLRSFSVPRRDQKVTPSAKPATEIKVVRCIRGALYDAIIDLRPDSPTFGKWFSVELTAENPRMILAHKAFAHGPHDAH